jgi:hypothetical protein
VQSCPEKLDQVHTIPARRFYVEALLCVVGSIVVSGDQLRLKMTLTARARLPMLAPDAVGMRRLEQEH